MVPTLLRRALEDSGMDDLAVCLYSLNTTGDQEARPLFFYHLEKNGGIAVHMALLAAHSMAEHVNASGKIYRRFHADDDIAGEYMESIRGSDVHAVAYVGKVGLRTYGVHAELDHPFRLMTLLRDPFDRLVSFYYYKIRRGVRPGPPADDDFMAFVAEPENRYYQCKMLSAMGAGDCDGKDAFDEAMANLEGFDWVGRTSDMEEILLSVWSAYGFYPFLSQRIHRNPHKKDTFEHLRDDVYEINRYDKDLFEHVSANPKILNKVEPETNNQLNLAAIFTVLPDSNRDDKGDWTFKCAATQVLGQFIEQKGGSLENLYTAIGNAQA